MHIVFSGALPWLIPMKLASQSNSANFQLPVVSHSPSAGKLIQLRSLIIFYFRILASIIVLLDEPNSQARAIDLLHQFVDYFWPEIAKVSGKM